MTRLLPIFLFLASCGAGSAVDEVTVRRYEDVAGNPTPNAESLGFTYYLPEKGNAKHGAAGYNCLVNENLRWDDDHDKLVRVIIHELANVCILADNADPMLGPGAYSWDSDTLPPFAPIPLREAEWFAQHDSKHVHARDSWLDEPLDEAIFRINEAASAEVFRR